MNKEVKQFVRMLKDRGWKLERRCGSGHLKMGYEGVKCAGSFIIAATPSDRRWLLNAQGDARRVEEKCGECVSIVRDGGVVGKYAGKKALDYSAPGLVNHSAPIEITHVEKEEKIMNNPDREFIIELLRKRQREILEVLGPHMGLFDELKKCEENLMRMGGNDAELPADEVKIKKYLEKKEAVLPAPVNKRYSVEEFYGMMLEVVRAESGGFSDGIVPLGRIATWLEEVHGVVRNGAEPVRCRVTRQIKLYNDKYAGDRDGTGRLELWPAKVGGDRKSKPYEGVRLVVG